MSGQIVRGRYSGANFSADVLRNVWKNCQRKIMGSKFFGWCSGKCPEKLLGEVIREQSFRGCSGKCPEKLLGEDIREQSFRGMFWEMSGEIVRGRY